MVCEDRLVSHLCEWCWLEDSKVNNVKKAARGDEGEDEADGNNDEEAENDAHPPPSLHPPSLSLDKHIILPQDMLTRQAQYYLWIAILFYSQAPNLYKKSYNQ